MGSKGKLFKKISAIDIIILLVIIAAVAGAGYKFAKSRTTSFFTDKTEKIEIEFYNEEVPDFVAKSIKIGDPCFESVQNASFGHVTAIKIDKPVSWVETEDGRFVAASKPGCSSIKVTMEANGLMGNNGVTIDKSVYYVGQTITLYVGNSALFYGRISDIRKKG